MQSARFFKISLVFIAIFLFTGALVNAEAEEGTTETAEKETSNQGLLDFSLDYPYDTTVVRSREFIDFDNQLSETLLDSYKAPKEIHVIYIAAPTVDLQSDGDEWVKGLYYYLITKERFPDVPFNFVVTNDGESYQGKFGSVDVQPFAVEQKNDSGKLVVAFLGLNENYDMDTSGETKLKQTLGYLLSYYDLELDDIKASDWQIQEPVSETDPAQILLKGLPSSHRWVSKLDEIIDGGVPKYATKNKRDYSAEKLEVISNAESVVGERLKVVVQFKNDSDFPWYKSAASQLILYVKGKNESDYNINGEWLSPEAVGTFSNEFVLPGEVAKFSFEMAMPYVPKQYTETFQLGDSEGNLFTGTDVEVKFKVTGGDAKLIEILDTGFGYLNLRSGPSGSSGVLDTVAPGDIYLLVKTDTSHYKIRLNDGTEGWVSKKYSRIVD